MTQPSPRRSRPRSLIAPVFPPPAEHAREHMAERTAELEAVFRRLEAELADLVRASRGKARREAERERGIYRSILGE